MNQLRKPSLNEQRCIARHQLGFYHGLLVAGVYKFSSTISTQLSVSDKSLSEHIARPLATCVQQHPILSTLVIDADGGSPSFRRASKLEIDNHIRIWSIDSIISATSADENDDRAQEDTTIEKAIECFTNAEFLDVSLVPPWRLDLVRLPGTEIETSASARYLISYTYSHSHGDGASGLAFHQTFSRAFHNINLNAAVFRSEDNAFWTSDQPDKPLPPSLDDLSELPISPSYLAGTVTSMFMPRAQRTPFWPYITPTKPWTGKPVFYDKETFKTAVQLISIDSTSIKVLLQKCRSHGVKLTGLLDSFIAHGLTCTFDFQARFNCLVSTIPIDLRKLLKMDPEQMGVMASVVSQTHKFPAKGHVERAWETTNALAAAGTTLRDQPIGLLRYAGSLKAWHLGKIGKARDETYELSNIMVFDPICNKQTAQESEAIKKAVRKDEEEPVRIENIYFAQPASVTGSALNFNVVSLKDGMLNLVVSWQVGAIGGVMLEDIGGKDQSAVEKEERTAVSWICKTIKLAVERFIEEN